VLRFTNAILIILIPLLDGRSEVDVFPIFIMKLILVLGERRVNLNGKHEDNCLGKHYNIPVFLKLINTFFLVSCCGSKNGRCY
jgi:hypothetical protein